MSKGGTTSGSTQIPAWLENAAIENINKARDVSQIGYTPYYGPDVAAFSPMQQQSMQSTGNAASAFGLAPQGFDAMAGMPQAQTFAGGVQGYSSAPLYEQSLDKLFANAPAQYNAMNNMFIDPFTGARPQGNYTASPTQVSQMSSGGGGGGSVGGQFGNDANMEHLARMAAGSNGNEGEYFGVNSQYNPYGYSTPTENISGEKDRAVDYRDMSFGEAGRRDVGFGEHLGNVIKGVTGIGAIGSAIDYGQGLADGFTPSPFDNGLLSQTSGPSMTQAESLQQMNQRSARYEADQAASQARAQADAQRAIDIAIAQEDAIAAGLLENLNLSAVTTPYRAPVITQSTVNSSGDGRGARQRSSGGYAKSKAPNEAGSRFGL